MNRPKSLIPKKSKSMYDVSNRLAKTLGSEEDYRHLADDLLVFAQQENSLDINSFPLGLLINPATFAEFSQHSEYFSSAYDTALRLIGARLKRLVYEGAIDRHLALEMLPLYDPEYRKWLISLKQKDETAGQTKIITVMIPEYPDSGRVPSREQKAKDLVADRG